MSSATKTSGQKYTSRNAPCPCYSGKKYKRCCLLKQKQEEQATIIKKREDFERRVEQVRNGEISLTGRRLFPTINPFIIISLTPP